MHRPHTSPTALAVVLLTLALASHSAATDPCACKAQATWTYLDPSKPRYSFSYCSQIPGETALGANAAVCQVSGDCQVESTFNPEWTAQNGGDTTARFKFCQMSGNPSPSSTPAPSPGLSPSPSVAMGCPCSRTSVRYTPAGGGPVINMQGCTRVTVQPDANIINATFGTDTICLVDVNCTSHLARPFGTNAMLRFQPCTQIGASTPSPTPSGPLPSPQGMQSPAGPSASPAGGRCPCLMHTLFLIPSAPNAPKIAMTGCTTVGVEPDATVIRNLFGTNNICWVDSRCTSPTAMPLHPGSHLLFEACALPGAPALPPAVPSPSPTGGRCACSPFPGYFYPSDRTKEAIRLNGCTTIDVQPDSLYLTNLLGSNSICIAQNGCHSSTARPLSPGGTTLFEACAPPGAPPLPPAVPTPSPLPGRCACSLFPGTFIPSNRAAGNVTLNGCTTIPMQPDADYVRGIFGTNSICIAEHGCNSSTAKPLVPGSPILFEACVPSGNVGQTRSPLSSPSPAVVRSPAMRSPSPIAQVTPSPQSGSPHTGDDCACSTREVRYFPSNTAHPVVRMVGCTTIDIQPDADYLRQQLGSNTFCLVSSSCSAGKLLNPASTLRFRPCTP